MSTQPEAMRVEDHPGVQGLAQLGRNAIDRVTELEQARARDNVAFKQLLAQRDALLEALKAMLEQFNYHTITGLVHDESAAIAKARAAIKAAEEGK